MDSSESNRTSDTAPHPQWGIATGIFFAVLAVYVLSSPGRIDIIDGQARYDVAYHWIVEGRPLLRDPVISPLMAVKGRSGFPYSYYGPAGSVFAMPLVWLGLLDDDPPGETSRFLFSLTSSVFGALVAVVLYLFYVQLGLSVREASAWALLSSFATLIWPASNSAFDNAQQAFFVIAALYLGLLSAERRSRLLAVIGGIVAGVLILYQEYFILIIPGLAISTLTWPRAEAMANRQDHLQVRQHQETPPTLQLRRAVPTIGSVIRAACQRAGEPRECCLRFLLFLAATSVGVALSLGYNNLRFGSLFQNGKVIFAVQRGYPLLGNPVAGFLTLLVSPGKSVFLYSPPIILAVWGFRSLWRRKPEIGTAVLAVTTVLVLFISCIAFAGGDWCWGPRYLVPLIPLWALAFPFVSLKGRLRRGLMCALLATGFVIQVLALSVENQRFFFERGLNDFFWAEDSWFYFQHSALFARVGEAVSLRNGLPAAARWFNSNPADGWSTYTVLGPPLSIPRRMAPQWIRQRKVFYLPRPWAIWMWWIKPDLRPINIEAWLGGLCGVALLGIALIFRGFQTPTRIRVPQEQFLEQRVGSQ